jgi:hypothetical protein
VRPGGVTLMELLLMATPIGEDILGIIKHWVKTLPTASVGADSINIFGVSISLMRVLS